MEELIKVTVKNDQQLVSARDLYKGLEINRKFSLWVKDNFKSFIEHEDFEGVRKSTPYNAKAPNGKQQEIQDYALTISMAKEWQFQNMMLILNGLMVLLMKIGIGLTIH